MPGYYEGKKVTFHSAAGADANGAVMNVAGKSVVAVQISGTVTTATLYFEATVDGTNWVGVQGVNRNSGAVAVSTTAAGIWQVPVLGFRLFRVRLDWTAGSVTAMGICTEGPATTLNDIDVAGAETVAVSTINSVAPQFDDTDKMAVSVYGKSVAAGDVPMLVDAAGNPQVDVVTQSAGENHIGEVGCNTTVVSVTPTITAGAYTALDIVGAIQTIANATRVSGEPTILQSITVTDLGKQSVELTIFFFNANPATGTYTDNIALTIHDTDMALCIGKVKVLAADYSPAAASSVATVANIGLPLMPAATSLFAIAQASSSAPTYASTGDLTLRYSFLRD